MKIEVKGLKFGFTEKLILDEINTCFKEGFVYSILGQNGMGKTTLIKNVIGVQLPRNGSIELDGVDISKIRREDLSKVISYVPQGTNMMLELDVDSIVMQGRNPYIGSFSFPQKSDYDAVDKAIKMVGIDFLRARIFSELSGGQKQLVLIARAISQDTNFIFLDEPTASLDIKNQHHIMKLIRALSKEYGKGIVMSLHDPELSYRYSDIGVLLKYGKVIESGHMRDLFTEKNLKEAYDIDFKLVNIGDSKVLTVI